MGMAFSLLKVCGWIPQVVLPTGKLPAAIVCHSYAIQDINTLTPLTLSVTRAAAELFHVYQDQPLVIFATTDFGETGGVRNAIIEERLRKNLLWSLGVPVSKIRVLYNTRSTQSEASETKKLLRKEFDSIRWIIQCVNDLHVRRALPSYEKEFGYGVRVVAYPVHCDKYTTALLPVWFRRMSIRYESVWALYMVATWVAWKLHVIK